MGELKTKAWVFIDFGTNLWENREEARSLARWEVVHDRSEALDKAELLGMDGDFLIDTSPDGTKRMLAVFRSELAGIENWDLYARNYIDTVTDRGKNVPFMSGCGCGILTGGCGCSPRCSDNEAGGAGCACGSSESCKCG